MTDYSTPYDNIARDGDQVKAMAKKFGTSNRTIIINEDTSGIDAEVKSADKSSTLFRIDYGNGPDRTERITADLVAAGYDRSVIEHYNQSAVPKTYTEEQQPRSKSGVTQAQITPAQDRAEAAADGEAVGNAAADGI